MVFHSASVLEQSSAAPQVLIAESGRPVQIWPEDWGITVPQMREFLDRCREDPGWRRENTMRDLVEHYIKPLTAGTGIGYALHVNRTNPKAVHIMLSHSWNENVEDFVDTLERTIPGHEALFVCSFSLFQNCDGSGPSISDQLGLEAHDSPFYRVLRSIQSTGKAAGWRWQPDGNARILGGVLLTLAASGHYLVTYYGSLNFCPPHTHAAHATLTETVCLETSGDLKKMQLNNHLVVAHCFSVFLLFSSAVTFAIGSWVNTYRGRMIAVPNREDKLYSRLWCVYEIFVANCLGVHVELAHSFATVGSSSCREASCSSKADHRHICGEIEKWGKEIYGNAQQGYDRVDSRISALTIKARLIYIVGTICVLMLTISHNLWTEHANKTGHIVMIVGGKVFSVLHYSLMFKLLERSAGQLCCKGICLLLLPTILFGSVCAVLGRLMKDVAIGSMIYVLGETMLRAAFIEVSWLVALHLTPRTAYRGTKRIVGFWVVAFAMKAFLSCTWAIGRAQHCYVGSNLPYLPLFILDMSPWPLAFACGWLWMVSWGATTPHRHMGPAVKCDENTSNTLPTQAEKSEQEVAAVAAQVDVAATAHELDSGPAAIPTERWSTIDL